MKNIKIQILIVAVICFCACTKKDKTTAENQQIENEVVTRASAQNNIPEQDVQSTNTTSERSRFWYWDYSKTEAEKISEAEAKLPNFNDITEAETWLMRTLELDTYEYVFIKIIIRFLQFLINIHNKVWIILFKDCSKSMIVLE